jgi:CheY-like chemotaxis protein
MIVDDDPCARRLVRDSLKLSGEEFDIWEADDGRSALDLIRAVQPDLVLLDLTMPEIGGIPVCSQIKGDPLTAHVRIVIVSARTEADFVENSLKAGATAYVTKPFQPLELMRTVRDALSLEQTPADEQIPA